MRKEKNTVPVTAVSSKEGLMYNLRKHWLLYVMFLPALLSAIFFGYVPLTGIVIAFKDFNIMRGIWGSEWVGFKYFIEIFSKPDMIHAVKNTLIYGFFKVFLGFPFPVVLALMFNELRAVRFKKVVQTIGYMPHFLSWISVVGLLYGFFAVEGPVNSLIGSIVGEGYEAKNILFDPKNFLGVFFWSDVWKSVGWSSVVYLAAITGIDYSLFEAAQVDGCGRLKQVWNIIIPSILPTMIIVFIMSLGSLVNQSFDQVYGLQNVFTQDQTETVNTLVYRLGIQSGRYSEATAFGLAQGVITLALMLFGNFVSKKTTNIGIV